MLVCCIHWFNPFVWLLLNFALRDMELACDERALKSMNDGERKAYANVLVSLASKQNSIFAAFGNSGVKLRIINIMYGRKISLAMAAASTIFCIMLAVMLLTNQIL